MTKNKPGEKYNDKRDSDFSRYHSRYSLRILTKKNATTIHSLKPNYYAKPFICGKFKRFYPRE